MLGLSSLIIAVLVGLYCIQMFGNLYYSRLRIKKSAEQRKKNYIVYNRILTTLEIFCRDNDREEIIERLANEYAIALNKLIDIERLLNEVVDELEKMYDDKIYSLADLKKIINKLEVNLWQNS